MGLCLGELSQALNFSLTQFLTLSSRCASSCYAFWLENRDSMTEGQMALVEAVSWLQTPFQDVLGFQHDVCDLREGWTAQAR